MERVQDGTGAAHREKRGQGALPERLHPNLPNPALASQVFRRFTSRLPGSAWTRRSALPREKLLWSQSNEEL
ncbi:hypothetical protein Y1Q_0021911 [Alligator mississippiensis]|uniref:Uncharacterized protein n=1 Tax=Alligator mississippiensis TaxID=8496 RepID=A0A151MTQ6_ALLMI|nr:hypothetical protein Y1Q_0021911 [Alligator mississippiensis]